MEGIDLRKYQREGEEKNKINAIMGKILSGRSDYVAASDDTKPVPKCSCGHVLEGHEKFCPECGKKQE